MSVILAIESSCDETGVAVIRNGREVLSNVVASQIDIHKVYGGVVPEIASRQHTRAIVEVATEALAEAGVRHPGKPDSTGLDLDAVAATNGPGLMGSLLVGVCFAKSLARVWGLPFIPVHHIEGHLFSVFIGDRAPEWPFLALVVSGGHTQLVRCDAPQQYALLGATRDDAVGESFDKVARLLDLPYPGGPSIQRAAEGGNPGAFDFPRALRSHDSLEFSYSGLKTAVLYALRDGGGPPADLAASFQEAAIDTLVIKTRQAVEQTGLRQVALVGGVAANRLLRERLGALEGVEVFMPEFKYCMDNAAMIGAAAHALFEAGVRGDSRTVPSPGLPLV
ncbi:MAG: tRNA (adenosine(37)-N6)-threonylcarbamoyltransferase complex transferase subunit TsaD [Candidatus Hydrogenedens sp.]|nr:tRNA (adenosine(37)-N6)-threonylcarbamoyltransferase complex transferase subunit TsaD [Candidatus Hydrogenedens sp.]